MSTMAPKHTLRPSNRATTNSSPHHPAGNGKGFGAIRDGYSVDPEVK